ncbi:MULTISPECIES: hypothetical protein [unclassified Thioalkalivibrio]|uniref:hypothetical protein n=1 Tax=unclassified Thioalkalivibrio TaxID=2621013 RepID=UPI00036A8D3A|nr:MULTISPECIES: hypothetical protein [unclassified Thioalkalivibrio]
MSENTQAARHDRIYAHTVTMTVYSDSPDRLGQAIKAIPTSESALGDSLFIIRHDQQKSLTALEASSEILANGGDPGHLRLPNLDALLADCQDALVACDSIHSETFRGHLNVLIHQAGLYPGDSVEMFFFGKEGIWGQANRQERIDMLNEYLELERYVHNAFAIP